MSESIALGDETSPEESEAERVLLGMARRKTGAIPAEILVRHVLDLYRAADWPVTKAAMEALLRRCSAAQKDALRIAARPGNAGPFGLYRVRRKREAQRPYRVLLESIDPLRGSCNCPDFQRNALATCKHLLGVVDELGARPRKFAQALAAPAYAARGPRLVWDPIRPLTGPGDWLDRIQLLPGHSASKTVPGSKRRGKSRSSGRVGGNAAAMRRRAKQHFSLEGPAPWPLERRAPGEAKQRAAMVEHLLEFAKEGTPRVAIDPALEELLRSERRRLGDLLAAPGAGRTKRPRISRGKLYPYQAEGVRRFLATGRLLLADDMGLGKTVQAIAAGQALWKSGRLRRGLIIVPASLKSQWQREWQAFSDAPVEVVEGSPEQRADCYRAMRRGFLIANYEQVLRDLALMQSWKPDLIVLDEAQRIKNWATKTATYVKQLDPRYRLVLTGTPMENRLEELASILDWVDDRALEPKWRLAPWHSTYVGREDASGGTRDVIGARNLDTLRTRLGPCMLRRRRQEVLRQLPPRTDTQVPVEITAAQLEEHEALKQPIASLITRAQKRPLTQPEFLRLMQLLTTQRVIANGLAQLNFNEVWPALSRVERPDESLLQSLSTPKLLELREILTRTALEQERKVVVFSQWRRMLVLAQWAMAGRLEEYGARSLFFTGAESQRQRARNVVEFHDDPDVRILFATDAGGVGLNLQRAASCCVNIELPWNPAVLEQRIGRIYRLGQKRPIDVYNLVSQSCIESRIAGLVADKKALFSGLFDGDRDEVRFDGSSSFLSTVERVVEPADLPAPGPSDAAEAIEDVAASGLDALLESADESGDPPCTPAGHGDTQKRRTSPPRPPAGAPRTSDIRGMLSQLQVERTAEGGLRIEAPPEAAAGLASLFEGLADVMRKLAD